MTQPQKITTKYREIMRRLTVGQSYKQIAAALNMSQSRLSVIVHSPLFQAELEKIESRLGDSTVDFQKRLQQYAAEAMTTNVDLMRNSKSESIKQKSAFDILDRAAASANVACGRGGSQNSPNQPGNSYAVNQFNLSATITKGDPELIGVLKKLTDGQKPIDV